MIELRRLQVLQHLAAYGTVAAAADVLHLTPPAVSQQLAALEREIGMPVVEKRGRRLRLTQAGELLAAHAEVVLADLAAAEAQLAALRNGLRGEVRLAAFASAARTLVPPVWRHLGEESSAGGKQIALQLIEQEPESAFESLRRREVDLAIVHGYSVLPREFPPGCEHQELMRDPVVLLLPEKTAARLHLAADEPVDLARVAEEPWLTPATDSSCYEMIQRACGTAGFVPTIHARSNDFSVLAALAAAGAGVALVPRLALPADAQGAVVHPLMVPVTRTLYCVARSGTQGRPDLKQVIELLRLSAANH